VGSGDAARGAASRLLQPDHGQFTGVGKFNFCAYRFYYTSSRGRTILLDWIARHVDQADRVEIRLPAYEHPETWLADIQVKIETQVGAPMSRVLTVAQTGGMETGEGSFTARITDPLCPFNRVHGYLRRSD
jgi:hypothetical protein